jgi:hypothetical protein
MRPLHKISFSKENSRSGSTRRPMNLVAAAQDPEFGHPKHRQLIDIGEIDALSCILHVGIDRGGCEMHSGCARCVRGKSIVRGRGRHRGTCVSVPPRQETSIPNGERPEVTWPPSRRHGSDRFVTPRRRMFRPIFWPRRQFDAHENDGIWNFSQRRDPWNRP